jgi:hypothetical protein
MPGNHLVFGDIEGKLDVLRVECTKRSRRVYFVHRLIEKHGRKGNMMKWRELLNGDCPRRDAHSLQERCDLVCPDLPEGALIEHPFVCVASRAFRVADVPWENPGYLCRCDTNRLSIIAGPCVLPFCDSHIASASVTAAPMRATAIVMWVIAGFGLKRVITKYLRK